MKGTPNMEEIMAEIKEHLLPTIDFGANGNIHHYNRVWEKIARWVECQKKTKNYHIKTTGNTCCQNCKLYRPKGLQPCQVKIIYHCYFQSKYGTPVSINGICDNYKAKEAKQQTKKIDPSNTKSVLKELGLNDGCC